MTSLTQRKLAIISGVVFCVFITLFSFLASLLLGQTTLSISALFESILQYQSSNWEHSLIVEERLPRAILALVVGASLAVSGTLLQALVRTPFASPNLISVNTSTVLFSVTAVSLFTITLPEHLVQIAAIGAVLSICLIYFLDAKSKTLNAPLKIMLSGLIITVLTIAITSLILLTTNGSLESAMFWLAGSISNYSFDYVLPLLPLLVFALGVTILLIPYINRIMDNDPMENKLELYTAIIKFLIAVCVAIFASISVVLAGLIGFVGLVVPYISHKFAGKDFRWVLPISALLGATLLLLLDTLSRVLNSDNPLPIGVITAVIGFPIALILILRTMSIRRKAN